MCSLILPSRLLALDQVLRILGRVDLILGLRQDFKGGAHYEV
jgi:hypothetical protein